ncbi:MAG: hypothetical protein IKN98_10110 [Bacteroidales bacterium]|nr:hypothetical protein [Bacteroidales bacterium]
MGKILKDLKDYAIAFAKDNNVNHIGDGYFYDFRHNIFGKEMNRRFEKMFLDGDGNELTSKACAPHSSSMMGYNFFHWIDKNNTLTIQFKDEKITYNEVFFEVKIPVLNPSRWDANMDIVLRNSVGDWLFIESKFLEYCECEKFDISDT